jgi:hypothetical protein
MLDVLTITTNEPANAIAPWLADDREPGGLSNVTSVMDIEGDPSFSLRTISVLVIDTQDRTGDFPIVELCLRYMARFECLITHAGSHSAATFALAVGKFDVVVCDANSLGLTTTAGRVKLPTFVVAEQAVEVSRKARLAGARECFVLDELSPRLLETAISHALRGGSAMF